MANMTFGVNILPDSNNTYSLGNSEKKWKGYLQDINGRDPESFVTKNVVSSSVESSYTAAYNHINGTYFMVGDNMYKATTGIPAGATITPGTNCSPVNIGDELQSRAPSSDFNLSYEQIVEIVQHADVTKFFQIGDQLVTKWSPDGIVEYDMPWDIVHFGNVVDENGDTYPGMYLQSHWALPEIQFDGNEAFYYCESALPAGTYYITMGNNWGNNVVANKSYSFTLTQNVPAGGQLVFTTATSTIGGLPDQNPSIWRVRSYASASSTSHIEMVTLSENTNGTFLGTLSSSTKFGASGLNNMQRASYGYNRWSMSGIRQWLNSDDSIGSWWNPQNSYDRPLDQLTSVRGFVAGLPSDFLDIIKPIKVTTALNTVSDSDIGSTEDTFDRFFLASLEQEYCVPQLATVEGQAWDYWKEILGGDSPQGWSDININPSHIRYAIENHSSPQTCRLRSAHRGYAYTTWIVNSSGNVTNYLATYSLRPCPACVIY